MSNVKTNLDINRSAASASRSPTPTAHSTSTSTRSASRRSSTSRWAPECAGSRWRSRDADDDRARTAAGGQEAGGGQTGICLDTTDVDADHAALKAAGVDVDDEVSRYGDPVPPMFWLRDPDGNSLIVVQPSA